MPKMNVPMHEDRIKRVEAYMAEHNVPAIAASQALGMSPYLYYNSRSVISVLARKEALKKAKREARTLINGSKSKLEAHQKHLRARADEGKTTAPLGYLAPALLAPTLSTEKQMTLVMGTPEQIGKMLKGMT